MAKAILVISILSGLIPLGSALVLRKHLSPETRLLAFYVGLDVLTDLVMAYFALNSINNLWLTHVYVLFQYSFFAGLFGSWQSNRTLRLSLFISIPIFIVIVLLSLLFLQNPSQFNTLTRPAANLIIMALAAYTLFALDTTGQESMFRQPRFWIACGALVYFGSSLAVVSLSNIIMEWSMERLRQLYQLHAILNILANLGFTAGYLCLIPRQRPGER